MSADTQEQADIRLLTDYLREQQRVEEIAAQLAYCWQCGEWFPADALCPNDPAWWEA